MSPGDYVGDLVASSAELFVLCRNILRLALLRQAEVGAARLYREAFDTVAVDVHRSVARYREAMAQLEVNDVARARNAALLRFTGRARITKAAAGTALQRCR